MSTPSDFAKSDIKFDKIDDLPKGKVATADQIMAAMRVLNKMIHAQAKAYGGKNSKLLPAGIAEGTLLQSVAMQLDEEGTNASVSDDLEAAYMCCNRLQRRIKGDEESLMLLLDIIKHVNSALAKAR